MATAQLSAAPRPSAHPKANPGYGKKSAPDQEPRSGRAFDHLPVREASIAVYLDRLDDEADISIKTLAKHLPYGQCAIGTALNNLSVAGHLRRVRRPVTVDGGPRWVWHTFFSRPRRDDAWWDAFLAGEAPPVDASASASASVAAAEPSRIARSVAYDVLARLGRIEPRLTLSASECGALEESAARWFARGASEVQIVQALTAGLPERVAHAYGFVRARLIDKIPPEQQEPAWPRSRPSVGHQVLCTACGEPEGGTGLRGGLCEGCWGARPGLAAEHVQAHAGRLRAALRTAGRTGSRKEKGAGV
ncbi:hypothetical protein [Streptomyces adelaidensis]|uniref:hypothetical protein n=1 Tax=Streptomyces adelaidensis TaxID=2796465 RepID=UPI001906A2FF|nr:hypothetical protein [Streptomyces adelaidensis]